MSSTPSALRALHEHTGAPDLVLNAASEIEVLQEMVEDTRSQLQDMALHFNKALRERNEAQRIACGLHAIRQTDDPAQREVLERQFAAWKGWTCWDSETVRGTA